MKRQILWATSLVMVWAGVCPAGQETIEDGILHVRNIAEPAQGREALELEELWRIGGDDDELFFGLVGQVRVDEAGNILLLDEILSQVFVLNQEGELINTLSRLGDGPGETRDPNDMVLLPDGRVGLATSGRLVTVDRKGDPAGDIVVNRGHANQGGTVVLTSVHFGGDNMVFGCMDLAQNPATGSPTRETALARYNQQGERLVTYARRDCQFGFQPFAFSEQKNLEVDMYRVGVGPDGRVYCATEYDSYRIMVYDVDGTVDRVVEREYVPVERTAKEYDDIFSLFDTMLQRAVPPPYDLTVGRCEPAICWMQKGLQIATDGRIWVLPSSGVRNQPQGVFQTFDVFSSNGHFEKQVSIPGEGDPRNDAVFLAGASHLVRVIGFADALRAKAGGGAGGNDDEEVEPIQVVYYAIR
jgi:hypothetical protein